MVRRSTIRGTDALRFSYSQVWDDAVASLRAHSALILPIAGVFLFLPGLIGGYLLSIPETEPSRTVQALMDYFDLNWPWLLLTNLIGMMGGLAILLLVLARQSTSVGGAIAAAAALLPFYFLASMIAGIPVVLGFMLFVVPGLYLASRLLLLGPAMVAEGRRNPVDVLSRSWVLTRGNGWAVAGFVLLFFVGGLALAGVISMVAGIVFRLLAGPEIGALLGLVVSTAGTSAVQLFFLLILAALYRRLSAAPDQPSTRGI
jgi:hypothetical protein